MGVICLFVLGDVKLSTVGSERCNSGSCYSEALCIVGGGDGQRPSFCDGLFDADVR